MSPRDGSSRVRAAWLTGAAMLAFASNSILCRMALRAGDTDPATFTSVRLAAGALVLSPLLLRAPPRAAGEPAVAPTALSLFVYAAAFSFAYVRLDAASGALILFGSVQLTMVAIGYLQGQRPSGRQVQGLSVSVLGLLLLTLPGVGPVQPLGAILMALAGAAWGVYSLRGRGSRNARVSTARNFVSALPAAALLVFLSRHDQHASTSGIALAACSGALSSALGYVLWYAALPWLQPVEAALVQLSVPVLTAVAGAVVIGEPLRLPTLVGGVAILVGIAWAVTGARR